jgi:peptidoglycan/xylan/chitin deacetylase (PgdA/CDA1 family)
LTFDDGLVDHAERVLPVLEERGLRGVFFVPGAVLTSHQLLPAHAIHLLLSTMDDKTLEREVLDYVSKHVGKDAVHLTSIDWAEAEAMYHYEPPARARVKFLLTIALPPEVRTATTNVLFERFVGSPERWARHWYMGWDDLARVQSSGHTVGAHGYTHAPYGGMTAAQRRDDMRKVNAVLCGGLGPGVRPCSYPYGQFDDDTCSACHEAGFAHAFTTERRWLTEGCDVFRLPRVRSIDVGVALAEDAQCVQA